MCSTTWRGRRESREVTAQLSQLLQAHQVPARRCGELVTLTHLVDEIWLDLISTFPAISFTASSRTRQLYLNIWYCQNLNVTGDTSPWDHTMTTCQLQFFSSVVVWWEIPTPTVLWKSLAVVPGSHSQLCFWWTALGCRQCMYTSRHLLQKGLGT